MSLIAAVACLFAVLHAAVHVIVHRVLLHGQNWYRMLPDGKKADYTLQIVWLLVGTPLPFAYAHTAFNLRDNIESRWHGASNVCMYAMLPAWASHCMNRASSLCTASLSSTSCIT